MVKISIIICSYNRDFYILDALESLKKQNESKENFEIIVVNNNSTDKTEEKCKKFERENPDLNFVYKVERKQGLSFARNTGIEISNTPLVAFIDDDAIAEEDYVTNLIKNFAEYPKYEAIGGKVIPIYPENKEPEWMSNYIQRLVSKVDDGEIKGEFKNKYPVGCNMAFRKEVFNEIGGFNTDLTLRSDDKYIFYKFKKAKKKTLYVPELIVHHNIEDFRLTPKFINKLSRLNGHSEAMRLRSEPFFKSIVKFFENTFKFGVTIPLSLPFIFRGQYSKAYYLIKVMFLTWIGFLYYKD